MASLRKASAYSKRYARPYTRKSKKRSKNYIRTVPGNKIVKMQMGDIKGFEEGKFKTILKMVSKEKVQIRDNAIESCRQGIVKVLEKNLTGQYYFAIKIHPHHILRENKMLTGAGADRMQSGMQLSFGKAIGRAALVKPKKTIFLVGVNSEKGKKITRQAFKRVNPKVPCKVKIITEEVEQKAHNIQLKTITSNIKYNGG